MKWKERVGITLAAGAVLLTCILVLDIRFAQNGKPHQSFVADRLIQAPRHGTSRQKDGKKFLRGFLDNNSANNASQGRAEAVSVKPEEPEEPPTTQNAENPADEHSNAEQSKVDAAISELVRRNRKESPPPANSVDLSLNAKKKAIKIPGGADLILNQNFKSSKFMDLMEFISPEEVNHPVRGHLRHLGDTLQRLNNWTVDEESSSWDRFHAAISREELYQEDGFIVESLLDDMAHLEFLNISQKEGGTQLKLVIEFPQEGAAMLKPMRFPREQETLPNHFYFTDYERANAEIASFHLDKIMGFRRAPPVVGRLVNMTTELYALATGDLLRTFFISPAQNLCFHGKCSYYCDTGHAICGNPDQMEASLAAFLPDKSIVPRKTWRHPWRRSYHKRKKAQWEEDDQYCEAVRQVPPYSEGRRLPDLIDLAIFDFLTGNMDRHHYETFGPFGNDTFPISLDQGRAFGRASHDEMSILAPLYQCCLLRRTTLATLLRFHHGPARLSALMKESLAKDPLDPILAAGHFEAMDRRVAIVLRVIRHCLSRFSADQVLVGLTEWQSSDGRNVV